MSNIYTLQSSLEKLHKDKLKFLAKQKRPIKSFKKSFKASNSIKTDIRRRNTAIKNSYNTKETRDLQKLHESISIKTAYTTLSLLREELKYPKKVIGTTKTKNYVIKEYKNPPKKYIVGWRRKKVNDHIINLAIVKDPDTGKTKTIRTSVWYPKESVK